MPTWQRWIVTIAAAKLVAAVVAYFLPPGSATPATPIPLEIFVVMMVCFGGVATFLLAGGPQDPRAVNLGTVLLLSAIPLTNTTISRVAGSSIPLGALVRDVRPEAFLPYFFWTFVRVFPSTHALLWQKRIIAVLRQCSLVVGWVLFVGAIVSSLLIQSNILVGLSQRLISLDVATGYYWLIVYSLALATFPMLIVKSRNGLPDERRRGLLFIFGIALGSAPIMIVVVAEVLSTRVRDYVRVPIHLLTIGLVLYAFLLLVPIVTAYSVIVHRVFDVRVAIRRAFQYALARSVVAAVTVLPALVLAYLLYSRRSQPVSELFQGPGPALLFVTAAVGLLMLRVRQQALGFIDRLFFRDQYDAHQILTNLVEACQRSLEPGELAQFVETQVDRALHLESIAVCVLAPLTNQFVAAGGKARALSGVSGVATLVREQGESVEIRLEDARSPLYQLPREDQEWLADGGFRLITPMLASDRSLVGLIALGDKKSELPFSQEDRLLLHALAVSAAPKLEMFVARERTRSSNAGELSTRPPATVDAGEPLQVLSNSARECRICDLIFSAGTPICPVCGADLVEAPIPALLAGKFQVERRIGRGAMGVVYGARDLQLGRQVAIKTLPKVAPSQAFRLRYEARTLGLVTHPNLVTIFGAETWRGTPLLIFEFLSGGTLAEKLEMGPLPIGEVVELGTALTSALDRIHRVGILHRDIKPSNIGFESFGTPKLLDFGLAHIVGHTDWDTSRDVIVGTPAYLSPEAATGQKPDASGDLWQLSMVLYESVTGTNPMRRPTLESTLEAVRRESVPDARTLRHDCPAPLADFLAETLNRDQRRRPRSASALHVRLQRLKTLVPAESAGLNVA